MGQRSIQRFTSGDRSKENWPPLKGRSGSREDFRFDAVVAGLGGFRYPFYEVYVNCAVFSVKDGQFFGVKSRKRGRTLDAWRG